MSQGKVFLIDDDPTILQLYSKALENAGFKVATTSQVIGTVNKINEFSPDVILLDVMMPALQGDKIVKILKDSVRSQPTVVLLSNKSEDELHKLTRECGADDSSPKCPARSPWSAKSTNTYSAKKPGQLENHGPLMCGRTGIRDSANPEWKTNALLSVVVWAAGLQTEDSGE